MKISGAYMAGPAWAPLARAMAAGGWHTRMRAQPLIFNGRQLSANWSVVDRLGEIAVPTLVIAGRDDFVFPPECQHELADGIPNSTLVIVDRAGHSPHDERPTEVMRALRAFLSQTAVAT
jgi:proline iminopeptidase